MSAAEPLTRIQAEETSLDRVTRAIAETMTAHYPVLQRYHQVWYEAVAHTWGFTHFLGVGVLKCPNDLWAYQDLITRLRPRTILEMGTFQGGSALWFAHLLDLLGIDGHVYTVDIANNHGTVSHPRITFIEADSTTPALARSLVPDIRRPLLVVLDSDHAEGHVRKELDLYAPLCAVGDRLVVEDTNISWPEDRGARGALEDYLAAHPGEWRQDLLCERWLLTMHPGGWLERVADADHR